MSQHADNHESNLVLDSAHEEPQHTGFEEDQWLISYADLMTLLFGLFVLLYSYANFSEEREDFIRVRKELAKYFGATVITGPEELTNKIRDEMRMIPTLKEMSVTPVESGVQISILSSNLFTSGSADLLSDSIEPLNKLGDLINKTRSDSQILVEGHCDDNPIKTPVFPSNWELSAARAAAVVRVLERAGMKAERLGAIGYGESRPAYPNRDTEGKPIPDNMTLNRRVVLKVSLPQIAGQKKAPQK